MPGSLPVRGRRAPIVTALALSLALLPAGSAHAAKLPVITKVTPMQVEVGQTLTIKGRGFRAGKNKNVVAFKRSRKPAVFVKVPSATTTKLTFKVPEKLLPFLVDDKGKAGVVRFRLRVLAKRFGKAFTATKLSPRIGPPGSSAPAAAPPAAAPGAPAGCGAVASSETSDADKDGMSDALETRVKTDPCKLDTDGDGVSDAFEYESALDLNSRALPFPGKKPYPNALDAEDAPVDFDQDGLTMTMEYAMWMYSTGGKLPLTYSDGDQDTNTQASDTPVTPATAALELNQDGVLTDDEKDVDGDGITNWDESTGRMKMSWWPLRFTGEAPYTGSPLAETSAVDPDSDGDSVPDGLDDQDHDGWNNLDEIDRQHDFGSGQRYWVQPYNPCLPDYTSRVCTLHPPFSGAWAPFDAGATLGPPPLAPPVPPATP